MCGIIGSIELYLSIQKQMENDHEASKSFYLLSVTIFKIISLDKEPDIKNKVFYIKLLL